MVTVFVLYQLKKLSKEITEPIIELYHKIKFILDAHNFEKKFLLELNDMTVGYTLF